MRRTLRPATLALVTALLAVAACASPTAPTKTLKAAQPTMDGFTVINGVMTPVP